MMSKWMIALVAATALVPAAAMAQDGRGRDGRRFDNSERAARFERSRDSGVQLGGEARARGGFERPVRPAFRNQGSQQQARPAPDAGARPQREGFAGPRFRGGDRPDRPAATPQPQRERPAFRPDRPAIDDGRGQRPGRFDRRGTEGLLNQGPEGRERFSRERQEANRRFEQRPGGDIRNGRPNWRVGDRDTRGDRPDRRTGDRDIRNGRQDWCRDDDRRFDGRRGDWRQGDRRWYGDNDWNRGDRNGWNGRGYGRGGWDRDWRRDQRYDWRGYRTSNRSIYRLPRYYAPRGYYGGYRRFGIGFTLSSTLFAPDYWIDDPYSYRLPDAYGPYRWVRYYNDALLVDLETGEVIDVEYDIFW